MTGEKLQAMRDRMDNQFIDSVEESEEFELEDKPSKEHKYYPVFARSYHLKLADLYDIEKNNGEEKTIEEANEKLEDVMHDLKEGLSAKNYKYYFDCLGYAWACKDYLDGEA